MKDLLSSTIPLRIGEPEAVQDLSPDDLAGLRASLKKMRLMQEGMSSAQAERTLYLDGDIRELPSWVQEEL